MLLLIGSNEELSQSLLTVAAKDQDVDFLDSGSHDVTNPESLNDAVRKAKPSIIVNCAGYHDFYGAETDRERAYALNSFLPRDLARISLEYRCDFFHVSSTTVFSGKIETPFREDDEREPLSVYGDSFLLGERFIAESGCPWCVMRLGDIMGTDILDMERISGKRRNAAEFIAPHCYLSPVSPRRAAQAAGLLIRRKARGLFHYSHDGHATLADVYSEILNIFNEIFHETIDSKIHEIDSREIPVAAERPYFNVPDNTRYREYSGVPDAPWQNALREYMMVHYNKLEDRHEVIQNR
jgi:dTDP-4-dehydrorhamnose reductase